MRFFAVFVLILVLGTIACSSVDGEDASTATSVAATPTPHIKTSEPILNQDTPTPQVETSPPPIVNPSLEDLYRGHEYGDYLYDGEDFGIQFFGPESITVSIYRGSRVEVERSIAAFFADFGVTDLSTVPILWCEYTGGTPPYQCE